MTRAQRRWMDVMTETRARSESLLVPNSFFAETFAHPNGANITGVQMGGRGGGRGLVARVYTVLNHTS